MTLLRTIPGVGVRTAEAVVAWIDDVGRFARNKQVGAYFGLVPCQGRQRRPEPPGSHHRRWPGGGA